MIKKFDMTLERHITSLNHGEFYVCVFSCDFFMHHFGSKALDLFLICAIWYDKKIDLKNLF
jgi:hypothetical protein